MAELRPQQTPQYDRSLLGNLIQPPRKPFSKNTYSSRKWHIATAAATELCGTISNSSSRGILFGPFNKHRECLIRR
jgi:hypothetical protein